MDSPLSGNNSQILLQAFSAFSKHLRKEICFYKKGCGDRELSFFIWMCSDLKSRITKLEMLFSDASKCSMLHSFALGISKLKFDIGIRRVPNFDFIYKNYLLMNSRLCITAYRNYLGCIKALENFEPSAEDLIQLHKLTWSEMNVLIGSLRNPQQLDACLKYNFYHVPSHCIPADRLSIAYIAIYQSKNMFGSGACIKYYGRVRTCELVSRNEIHEIPGKSSDMYYKFYVDKWESLPEPIEVTTGGAYFSYTNLYMLKRASQTHELYFKNESECRMYYSISDAVRSNKNKVSCRYNNGVIAINNRNILVYKNKAPIFKVTFEEYAGNKGGYFKKIIKLCE